MLGAFGIDLGSDSTGPGPGAHVGGGGGLVGVPALFSSDRPLMHAGVIAEVAGDLEPSHPCLKIPKSIQNLV